MINALHLLWIIPLSVWAGMLYMALMAVNKRVEDYPEKCGD